jgi:cobalt-zinc-cadmium efflux system membrane fusion protein
MFVTVRFFHRIENAMIIKSGSVFQDNNKCFLFVQNGPDGYVKREVCVISIPDNRFLVRSGIQPGDVIVSEGGIYLY